MKESFAIPGVGGIIRKFNNGLEYILIQDRVKFNYKFESGIIEIPAGKIREFENIYSCLRREVLEETGLHILTIEGEDVSETILINDYEVLSYTPFSSCQNLSGSYPIMVQVFLCTVKDEGLITKESNESKNIRWIEKTELKKLLEMQPESFFPMHITTLKKYCNI